MKKSPLFLTLAAAGLVAISLAACYIIGKYMVAEYFSTQKSIQVAALSLLNRFDPNPLPVFGEDPHQDDTLAVKTLLSSDKQALRNLFNFPASVLTGEEVKNCALKLHDTVTIQLLSLETLFDTRAINKKSAHEVTQDVKDFVDFNNEAVSTLKKCSELYNGDTELNDVPVTKLIPDLSGEAPAPEEEPLQARATPTATKPSIAAVSPIPVPNPANCPAPAPSVSYSVYTAEGMTFDYPASLTGRISKAGNGTVYQFASADQCLQINIHRYFNTMATDAAGLLERELEARNGVTYKFHKGDTFAIAGVADNWGYYKRGIIYGESKYYVADVEVLVPEARIKEYSDVISHISKSVKVTGEPTEPEYLSGSVDWHATRNTSRDFYRVFVKSRARDLEVDYQSDALPANCLQGIKEDMQKRGADYAYCVQSYRDDVSAREKARWGL